MTFAAITLFLANVWGWIIAHWRLVLTIAAIIALLIAVIVLYRSCKKTAKIDLETVDKINNGNRAERMKELQKIIEENSEVIKTVDNRSNVAEVNVVERNREIDAKIKEADKKILEAKEQGKDITQEQLECILTGEMCQ
jgi:hypothetical protein